MRKTTIHPDGRIEEAEIGAFSYWSVAREVSSGEVFVLSREKTFLGEPAVWFVKNDVSEGRVNKLAIKLLKMDHGDTCHDNIVEKVVVVSGITEGEAWDENVRGKVL